MQVGAPKEDTSPVPLVEVAAVVADTLALGVVLVTNALVPTAVGVPVAESVMSWHPKAVNVPLPENVTPLVGPAVIL